MKPCVSEQLQYYNLLTSEIDEAYHNASLKLGLSDSAMMILYALCSRENPCPLLEIARLTGISRQATRFSQTDARDSFPFFMSVRQLPPGPPAR